MKKDKRNSYRLEGGGENMGHPCLRRGVEETHLSQPLFITPMGITLKLTQKWIGPMRALDQLTNNNVYKTWLEPLLTSLTSSNVYKI